MAGDDFKGTPELRSIVTFARFDDQKLVDSGSVRVLSRRAGRLRLLQVHQER